MLTNLHTNARTHTPPGTSVDVLVDGTAPGTVRLVVADSAPKHRTHLFERFYQADSARSGHGCGLGLSIVEAIVRAHGGAVGVDEGPGGGARFTVALPTSGPPTPQDANGSGG